MVYEVESDQNGKGGLQEGGERGKNLDFGEGENRQNQKRNKGGGLDIRRGRVENDSIISADLSTPGTQGLRWSTKEGHKDTHL